VASGIGGTTVASGIGGTVACMLTSPEAAQLPACSKESSSLHSACMFESRGGSTASMVKKSSRLPIAHMPNCSHALEISTVNHKNSGEGERKSSRFLKF
jgi:hypothetical protein